MSLPLFHICPASKTILNNKNKLWLLVQMCTQSLTAHCMAFISCIFRTFQLFWSKNVNICGIAFLRAARWDDYCYFKTMQDFPAASGRHCAPVMDCSENHITPRHDHSKESLGLHSTWKTSDLLMLHWLQWLKWDHTNCSHGASLCSAWHSHCKALLPQRSLAGQSLLSQRRWIQTALLPRALWK